MLGVAEFSKGMHLRRAALLLFAQDIYRWHPRSEVRILRIKGIELKTGRDYNVISDESARGNITQLLTDAWEKLRPHLVETKFSTDALFKQRIMYPEDACREALTNALAHRDYSIEGRSIEIKIFDDRMEITSPGALLSNLTIKDLTKLTGAHQSRNSFIARVLKEIGYMREMGEGIRRIFSLMKLNDLIQPEIFSDENTFNISLHSKSVFTEEDQRFLKGFDFLNLTREESLIALLGKNHEYLSPQQIYDHLELVDWDDYRKIIDQVQIKGLLFNARTEEEKKRFARNKKISQRDVKRLKIRTPKDCEEGIKNLTDALKQMGFTSKVFQKDLLKLNTYLPSTSIYYDNNSSIFLKRLKFLNLIDNSNEPTSLLFAIWGVNKVKVENQEKKNKVVELTEADFKTTMGSEKMAASEVTPKHTVFLEGVDYYTRKEDLFALFANSKEIVEISVPIDFYKRRGRGFAFITVQNKDFGDSIIQNYNNTTFRDRIIRLSWSKK